MSNIVEKLEGAILNSENSEEANWLRWILEDVVSLQGKLVDCEMELKATQDELDELKRDAGDYKHEYELNCEAAHLLRDVDYLGVFTEGIKVVLQQLATAKLEGFNEGIEAAANHALSIGKELNTVGYVREIRALKRECVSTTLEVK